jgi:predicted enzyme related to lactoylglutathione lyase
MPYIFVTSADDTAARVAELGGTVHAPPFDVMDHGRMSVVQDPTGGMFCVWQPIKTQGTGITNVDGTVVWADLSTPDQGKAAQFYGDLFGWKMVGQDMKPAAPGDYFHIVNGSIQPAEHRPEGVPAHWLLYYQVSDCDGTVAKVKSRGGKVVMPTMTMGDVRKFAVVSDPQGAVFALVQELGGKETGKESIKPAAKRAKPAAKRAKLAAKRAKPAARKKARKVAPKKAKKAKARPKRKGKAKK